MYIKSNKGKNGHLGMHHSEEAKLKISKANKGRKLTKEQVMKSRKSLIGKKLSEEHRKKLSIANSGERNSSWIDGRTYTTKNYIHRWISKEKGKAQNYKCVDCNKQALDWSNKDHKYKKVLEDYRPRCRSCHIHWDIKFNDLYYKKYKRFIKQKYDKL